MILISLKYRIIYNELYGIFSYNRITGHTIFFIRHNLSKLKPGDERKFSFRYTLGLSEENTQVLLITPPDELLIKLKDYALDATLVVLVADKEIARFDLNKK